MPTGAGRGGARKGAGRKKGGANLKTTELRKAIDQSGELPIEYMMRVMRDPQADDGRRDDMARAAAPYLHPRLAAVEVSGKDGGPIPLELLVTQVAQRRQGGND